MGIKELLQKFKERKERLSEYENELRLRRIAEQRMKSGQERELEGIMEEKRQEKIKEMVTNMKRQKEKEFWITRTDKTINVNRGYNNGLFSGTQLNMKTGLFG